MFRSALALCVVLPALIASAQPREIQELMKIQEKALADAKELASSSLPDPKSWGEDWKKPWELPAVLAYRVNSEQEYWDSAIKHMGGAGLTQADAEKVLSVFTQGFAQRGMSERDGLIQAILALRRNDAPTAQQTLLEWESAAALTKLAQSGKKTSSDEAYKQMVQASAAPFQSISDADLKATYLREATLLRKRTKMSFHRCNNWGALANVKSDADIVRQNLWIGSVDVKLMFADESRLKEIQDLPESELPNLQNRLQAAVMASMQGTQAIMKGILDKDLEKLRQRAEANPDDLDARRQAADAQKRFDDQSAAIAQVKVSVVMRQFGDNSYVVRLTGANPDISGDRAGMYVGWIRKGHVMAEISAKGRIPDAELSKSMDHFLSEMDAKLASYDSSLAGLMKIDPAGAMPTPPETGTTSAAPAKEKAKPPAGKAKPPVSNTDEPPTPPENKTASRDNTVANQPTVEPAEFTPAHRAYENGDFNGSKMLVEQALQKSPNHAPSLILRGALRNKDNDLAGALADYRRASEIDPNNPTARRFRAFFELVAGDARVAAKEADAAIKLWNGDAETLLLRAQAAMAMDRPEEAKPYFDQVLKLNPNRTSQLYAEANTALGTKSYMVANLQFQTVLWMDPNQYPAHFGRAVALEGLGRGKQAIAAYQRYLKSDSTSSYAQQAKEAIKRLKNAG